MIFFTIGVAIFDEHARFTCLETNVPTFHAAAIGTAVSRRIVIEIVHRGRRYFCCESLPRSVFIRQRGLMIVRRMAVAEVAVAAGCRKLECTVEMIIGHEQM